ncbi:hypothetical protein OOJ09_18925 [Mesorhizobium qingshengii]|uniref:Proteasome subunit beta n=1 Tax=Mesorhizobium qingshengii TaxID=1165689 RepID=A0ABT4QXE6_9HYPH|nr:hypothetical protein [Mesorhizobium qingshengii]MCZ8546267.1 hypothetical protein [Mesorhizobium qingshengii]
MSAFYSVAFHDRIEILTDGVFYHPDGTLLAIMEKVWRHPNLPVAIVGRGSFELQAYAETVLAWEIPSVDDLLVRATALMLRMQEFERSDQFEALIAGISETGGPLMLYFSTAKAYAELEPWTPYFVGPAFGGGPVPAADDLVGLDLMAGLAACGVQLFEAMRKVPGPNPTKPGLPEVYGIGGHVDLTVVDASGARTTRLHAWPEDVVGYKIAPASVLREAA